MTQPSMSTIAQLYAENNSESGTFAQEMAVLLDASGKQIGNTQGGESVMSRERQPERSEFCAIAENA